MKIIPLCLAGLLALGVTAGALPAGAQAPVRAAAVAMSEPRSGGGDDLRHPGEARGGPADTDEQRGVGPRDAKGTDTVVVLRAYYTSPDSATEADVDQAFAASDAWFNVVSLGQFRITATSAPTWVAIAPSDCANVDQVVDRAVAAQRQATPGFEARAYDHVVVYIPHDSSCEPFAGRGEQPGRKIVLYGPPPNTESSLSVRTITHELGHNLGLAHSMSLACTGLDGAPAAIGSTCAAPVEYGDTTDNMGGSRFNLPSGVSVVPAFSASQQAKLGWLSGRLRRVTPCQDVSLAPYEGASGTVAARVAGGEGIAYWLEYRHPAAGTPDAGLPATLRDGTVLHMTTTAKLSPFLLDGRPDAAGNMADAAIPAGGSVVTREGYLIRTAAVGGTDTVQIRTLRPTSPLRVRARGIPGGARVFWGAPPCAGASPITSYRIDVHLRGRATWHTVAVARGSRTSFRIALPKRAKYAVRVVAVNAQGPSVRPTGSAGFVRPLPPLAGLRAKSPGRIVIGGTSKQVVTLISPRTHRPLRGVRVVLQQRTTGRPWRALASISTNRAGIATRRTAPRVNTRYRWVFRGSRTISPTTSRVVRVAVAPRIGLVQSTHLVRRGSVVTFAGVIDPRRPGQRVALQAEVGSRWLTLKVTRAVRKKLPGGRRVVSYRFGLRFPLVATFRLRTVTRPTRTNAAGVSRVVTVRVRT